MQTNGKKQELTLREMMMAQGKIPKKPQNSPAPKPQVAAPKPQAAPKPRTEEEKKRQAEELARKLGEQAFPKPAQTKEDKLREMVEQDPALAAELLREIFLKGN